MQSEGMQYLGIGAGIGVLLFMSAVLLLRRDFTEREQVFLILLDVVGMLGLLVSGSTVGWIAALTLPFLVIMFGPGRKIPVEPGVEYRNWYSFWREQRHHVKGGFWRAVLPSFISVGAGAVCFIAFLCIFASGNPVVQIVWDFITTWWNRLMEFVQISWNFWGHVLVWVAGVLGFGLFTVRRPPRDVNRIPAGPDDTAPAGRSMLPHLPLMMLLGVNLAFLVATGTDIAFLWFQRVPEGVSQTEYLYEGADSIIWASVLAAVLLVYFFRRKGSVRRTVAARGLGYLLAVQTLLLAISVYVRLYNQIMAHAFTPRRILAAEFLLLGVVGLVILLCYMSCSGGFLRYARLCIGVLGLMGLCFTISKPTSLSGDLNLRYAAAHPEWKFSTSDFKRGCFEVQDNLAFALYVYEKQKATNAGLQDMELTEECCRLQHQFWNKLKIAALALERRRDSWILFTLRDYWDCRAAEFILGRPLGTPSVEPVH